jgi:hypothetical protein
VKSALRSLRRKLLGETWTIPLGVGAAIALALLARAVLPHPAWQTAGGFVLAAALIATVIHSLPTDRYRRKPDPAAELHQLTTTRIDP